MAVWLRMLGANVGDGVYFDTGAALPQPTQTTHNQNPVALTKAVKAPVNLPPASHLQMQQCNANPDHNPDHKPNITNLRSAASGNRLP